MEACPSAHHWAREMIALGHAPKLMAPKFVTPYRIQSKRGKNDANDAAAICEASSGTLLRQAVPTASCIRVRLEGKRPTGPIIVSQAEPFQQLQRLDRGATSP
jgi:transposase